MSWEKHEVAGHVVEYDDDTHSYIVDGIEVPSVTQLIHRRFPKKYENIPKSILERAAEKGTLLHETIEAAEKGDASSFVPPAECEQEFRNYLFLKRQYGFTCMGNEILLVIPYKGKIVAAGRMDMLVSSRDGETGVADIKRTSVLDANYLSYQLTLYAIGLKYRTGVEPVFGRCIWLREEKRKYKAIPFCYDLTNALLAEAYEEVYGDEDQREDNADIPISDGAETGDRDEKSESGGQTAEGYGLIHRDEEAVEKTIS